MAEAGRGGRGLSRNKGRPPQPIYEDTLVPWEDLPPHTRAFLQSITAEEAIALADLLTSYERAKTIGWFFKWLFFTMVGAFMGAVAFGEALSKLLSWVASASWRG